MKKITKAVFPVAGMGTRFLPATKANPKEMLPIVDKPLIQYAVEEAIAAGITDMIFITGRNKRAIEDHFDKNYELEKVLEERGKFKMLQEVRSIIPQNVNCIFVRQADALGLGHAVLCAMPVIGEDPFAVLLADDLIDSEKPTILQMIEVYEQNHCSVLGVQDIPLEETERYGVVKTDAVSTGRHQPIMGIVEKPKPADAPSTLAVVGRYILTPRIFHHLLHVPTGAGGEIQLTDGIADLMKEERVLAYQFHGTRYDCGSKLGYLQATLAFALKHPEVSDGCADVIRSQVFGAGIKC